MRVPQSKPFRGIFYVSRIHADGAHQFIGSAMHSRYFLRARCWREAIRKVARWAREEAG